MPNAVASPTNHRPAALAARLCGALALVLTALAVLAPMASADNSEWPTSTTLSCVEEAGVPGSYICTATVFSIAFNSSGGEIGIDAWEYLHENFHFEAMKVNFANPNGTGFFGLPFCLPASELHQLSEVVINRTSCRAHFFSDRLGPNEITASFSSENVGGTKYLDSHESQVFSPPPAATSVGVSCLPAAIVVHQTSTCTVNVSHEALDPRQPAGVAELLPGSHAELREGSRCPLAAAGVRLSSCSLTVTATELGTGNALLAANYSGQTEIFQGASTLPTLEIEKPHPTEVTLACNPTTVSVRETADCVATVVDKSAVNKLPPTGSIAFQTDSAKGSFDKGVCVIAASGTDRARCPVEYTPLSGAAPINTLTAIYQADPGHQTSRGTAQIHLPQPQSAPAEPLKPGSGGGAPDTKLKKKPAKKTASHAAKFTFLANQPGAKFQCKLDKQPFKPCKSPFAKKVKPGAHVFQVRAVSPAGLADPTPAAFHWKVS